MVGGDNMTEISLLTEIAPENKLLNGIGSETEKGLRAFIAVSFIQNKALKHLSERLKEMLNQGREITIFTSGYLHITEPMALYNLLKLSDAYHPLLEVNFNPGDRFHSKFLLFEKPKGKYTLFLGSSNISMEGLAGTGELNVKITGEKSDRVYRGIKIVIENLKKNISFERLDTALIENYEAEFEEINRKKRKITKGKIKRPPPPIPPLKQFPIYVVGRRFTSQETEAIEAKHPKWDDYVSYYGGIKTLKGGDYFLFVSNFKGEEKTFTVAKYIVHDYITRSIGTIAHIKSGTEIPLNELDEKFRIIGIKKRDLINGKKPKLDSFEWNLLERLFRRVFPKP
jgi:HKD family nuclease